MEIKAGEMKELDNLRNIIELFKGDDVKFTLIDNQDGELRSAYTLTFFDKALSQAELKGYIRGKNEKRD